MTAKKSYLCVGGPEAGKRYAAFGDAPYLRIVLKEPLHYQMTRPLQEPTSVKTITYVAQHWNAGNDRFTVWVPEKQTPQETIELLLETYEIYRRNKE